ncbi:hypothetical protein SPHINGOAX6_20280 [Sphingomonas sp. AX6]|nr:hypothetical protein SPHINGOAX6_20280 [Sphingomonas sp. AX6]
MRDLNHIVTPAEVPGSTMRHPNH